MNTIEAAQPAAHFAQRETQRQPAAAFANCDGGNAHGALKPSMWPERSRTIRPQRAASAASCVTRTSVEARSGVAGEQEIDDLLAGVLVEVSGRFVGHDDRWIGRERARHGHALLLAAGQLGRIVMQPLA